MQLKTIFLRTNNNTLSEAGAGGWLEQFVPMLREKHSVSFDEAAQITDKWLWLDDKHNTCLGNMWCGGVIASFFVFLVWSGASVIKAVFTGLPFNFYSLIPLAITASLFGLLFVLELCVWIVRRMQARRRRFSNDEIRKESLCYFRDLIKKHREDMLGEHSEFSRLRMRLEKAREEALSACDYWEKRADADAADAPCRRLAERAGAIRDRIHAALHSLEKQKQAVLAFFRKCEAQLTSVETGINDYFEELRLKELSRETEDLISETREIAFRSATSFLEEAIALEGALNAAHEELLLDAALYEIEDMSALAEKIVSFESSSAEAVRRLEAMLRTTPASLN